MTLNVIYRTTVYAPKGIDASETTVLSPIAGAAHSDLFKIATAEGVTGFKPYMGMPSGRRGRIDILAKKTDTGELSFDVLDMRTTVGGSNALRWVTAFLGDNRGLPRFARLKCLIEESLDGGITWTAFFTGRVKSLGLKSGSLVTFSMTVQDVSADLTYPIFTGRPHGNVYQTTERIVTAATSTTISDSTQNWTVNQWAGAQVTITKATGVGQRRTVISNTATQLTVAAWTVTPDTTSFYSFGYAQLVSALPVGFVYPYGGTDIGGNPLVAVTKKLDGKIGIVDATNGWAQLNLDRTTGGSWITAVLNSTLYAGVKPTTVYSFGTSSAPDVSKTLPPQFTGVAIARVLRKDTGAEGDFQVGFIIHITTETTGVFGVLHVTTQSIVGMAIRPVSYPIGVATGAPKASGVQASSPSAATQNVTTKGWTISITGILAGGDIISFSGHNQRYQVVSTATSDGSGNSTVTLAPGLQSAIADNEVITVQTSPGRMALPPTNTLVQFSVVCDMRMQDGGKQNENKTFQPGNLLLINDVHPAQVLRDACLGYYGRVYQPTYDAHSTPTAALPPGKNLGDPWWAVAVKDTDPAGDGRHGFNALIADQTFPSFRCIIDAQMPIRDFIEQYICKPYGIGYYFDGAGNFVPVDMRQPGSSVPGIVTITDADLVNDNSVSWTYDASQAVTNGAYTVYAEAIIQPIAARMQVGDSLPTITTKMFDVAGGQIVDLTLGNQDLSQKQYQLDAKGYRAMPGETQFRWQGGVNVVLQTRWDIIQQAIQDMATKTAKRPYGNGPMTITVTATRNANTAGIYPGSFFVLNSAANPDPATNTRGPIRLIMCSERAEAGPTVRLTGVDWGLTSVANVPISLGNPVNLAGDTAHSQTSVVTLNAQNEAAEVWINVTTTSVGSRPADTDPNWTFAAWANVTGWTVTVRNLPTGSRVYWRARTNPQRLNHISGVDQTVSALKTPSAWIYPAVDHADLSTMTAPTGLVSGSITANSFTVSWTPADATRMVEVWLATPVTDARTRIATLAPGAKFYSFTGLGASKTYRVAIREIDGVGGYAEATLDVTTNSTAPIINPPINTRQGRLML